MDGGITGLFLCSYEKELDNDCANGLQHCIADRLAGSLASIAV